MKIVIVGAGIVGACLAYRLAKSGADVTVLEAGLPAGLASGRNFGWINASFFVSEDHFRLRVASIAAHHRLAAEVAGYDVRWSGCLWWEREGPAMDALARQLTGWGYPVAVLDTAAIRQAEPLLGNLPQRALRFASEGAADGARLTRALLRAAKGFGAVVRTREAVITLTGTPSRITGVLTPNGAIVADVTVLATGCATDPLLAPFGASLGVLRSRGTLLLTHPVEGRLSHVIAGPDGELRQRPDGRLLMPVSVNHQAVSSTGPDAPAAIEAVHARLRRMLPGQRIVVDRLVTADRPVPADGVPAVGTLTGLEGLVVAVMHSGITLAPVVAEALAAQVLSVHRSDLLRPFAPKSSWAPDGGTRPAVSL